MEETTRQPPAGGGGDGGGGGGDLTAAGGGGSSAGGTGGHTEQEGVVGTVQVAGLEPQPAEKLLKLLPKLLHDQLGVTAGLLAPQATLSEPKVPPGFTHASGAQSVGLLPSPRQKGVDVEGSWK